MKNNDRRRNPRWVWNLHADIEDLITNTNYLDNNEIVMRMKSYQNKSMNSTFELLDVK
jgi:hypothetical protein